MLGLSNFSIDYGAKRLSFGPPTGRTEPSQSVVPMEVGPGYLVVRMEVQGQPVRLMLDTGAPRVILFEPQVRSRLAGMRVLGVTVHTNGGGQVRLTEVELPAARLGSTDLTGQRVLVQDAQDGGLPDFDGLLGVASLGVKRSIRFCAQADRLGTIVR